MSIDFGAVSLDEGLENLQAVSPFPIVEPIPECSSSASFSRSSIRAAEKESSVRASLKPQLEAPKHYLYGQLDALSRFEKLAEKGIQLFETESNRHLEEIHRTETEKMKKVLAHAEALKAQKPWGVLASLAEYVTASTTVLLGAAAFGAAPWIGGALIASGVLALGGKIMKETGTIDAFASWIYESEEKKKGLAAKIEIALFTLSFGLGLVGGVSAYSSGVFQAMTANQTLKKIAEGVGAASMIGSLSAKLGSSFIQRKKALIEADLQEMDAKTTLSHFGLDEKTRDMKHLVESIGEMGDQLKRAIQTSMVSFD